jgi:hypothetical protein
MRRTLLILIPLFLSAGVAAAAPPCTGPMAKSCIKKLFKCFKPKGTCMGELLLSPTGVRTLQCWDNGARVQIDAGPTSGTVQYLGARGRRCLRGAIAVESPDSATFVFKRKRKTWTMRGNEADEIVITCPDGTTEVYTEAEVNMEPPSCGGLSAGAACQMGDCP